MGLCCTRLWCTFYWMKSWFFCLKKIGTKQILNSKKPIICFPFVCLHFNGKKKSFTFVFFYRSVSLVGENERRILKEIVKKARTPIKARLIPQGNIGIIYLFVYLSPHPYICFLLIRRMQQKWSNLIHFGQSVWSTLHMCIFTLSINDF